MTRHVIREAATEEFPVVATLMQQHAYGLQDTRWISWKYRQNPAGRGRLLIAQDAPGAVVGTLGLLPRRLESASGREVEAVEFVDLFVAPQARRSGIGSRLWQYGTDLVSEPKYAFPNAVSEHIGLRTGWRRFSSLEPWYFPAPLARGRDTSAGRTLDALVRWVANAYTRLFVPVTSAQYSLRMLDDGERFSDCPAIGHYRRRAGFLNWRFTENPRRRYLAMEVRRDDGACVGHAVLGVDRRLATLFDFAAPECERDVLGLLLAACRERGVRRLRARGARLGLWHLGFIRIPTRRNVVSHGPLPETLPLWLRDCDW
ncbi:MAG TPA: GNAT family N-acetyltransferase [Gemmatimonadaceae bacterium]|nr:GNAT family N-acetyltransferase [Gemmatimonadaceae bacterium]